MPSTPPSAYALIFHISNMHQAHGEDAEVDNWFYPLQLNSELWITEQQDGQTLYLCFWGKTIHVLFFCFFFQNNGYYNQTIIFTLPRTLQTWLWSHKLTPDTVKFLFFHSFSPQWLKVKSICFQIIRWKISQHDSRLFCMWVFNYCIFHYQSSSIPEVGF